MKKVYLFMVLFILASFFGVSLVDARGYYLSYGDHEENYYQYLEESESHYSSSSSSDSASSSYSYSRNDRDYPSYRWRYPYYGSDSRGVDENRRASSSSHSSSVEKDEYDRKEILEYHYSNDGSGRDRIYLSSRPSYREHGYVDYNYEPERVYYSGRHYRDYYGSPDYYIYYSPYTKNEKVVMCNHYPPRDSLFYVKCP